MSWLAIASLVLVPLVVAAVLTRRPVAAGAVGGLLLGPALYLAVGIQVARQRGVGRFVSVPFGDDGVGDLGVAGSLAAWTLAIGLLVGVATHLLHRRRRTA